MSAWAQKANAEVSGRDITNLDAGSSRGLQTTPAFKLCNTNKKSDEHPDICSIKQGSIVLTDRLPINSNIVGLVCGPGCSLEYLTVAFITFS